MQLASVFLIYVLTWWVVFFMVLPFGIEPQQQDAFGASAPVQTHLGKKIAITTALAAIVTAGIIYVIQAGWIPV